MERKCPKKTGILLVSIVSLLLFSITAISAPDSVTITSISNTTKTSGGGTIGNLTSGSSDVPDKSGGYIFTMNLTGESQNLKWKAFIGNISGKLVLQDSVGYNIYDWALTASSGEVYASRSDSVNWSGIGCAPLNISEYENRMLNHSSPDDNITATFNSMTGGSITVGTTTIPPNLCNMTNIYTNNTATTVDDNFEELLLYDLNGTDIDLAGDESFLGNVVYAQVVEQDALGYNNQSTFDFQLIVPEKGNTTGWESSIAYYFYMELS